MKSHVTAVHPTGGNWDGEDAITQIDPRGPRATRHRNLLRAVLLFHSQALWDSAMRARWKLLTGKDEASARSLCDAIREAGLSVDELLR